MNYDSVLTRPIQEPDQPKFKTFDEWGAEAPINPEEDKLARYHGYQDYLSVEMAKANRFDPDALAHVGARLAGRAYRDGALDLSDLPEDTDEETLSRTVMERFDQRPQDPFGDIDAVVNWAFRESQPGYRGARVAEDGSVIDPFQGGTEPPEYYERVQEVGRRLAILRDPKSRGEYLNPADYENALQAAEDEFGELVGPDKIDMAKSRALAEGVLPVAVFTDSEGNRRVETSPDMDRYTDDPAGIAAVFEANPHLDKRLLGPTLAKLTTLPGYETTLARMERNEDLQTAIDSFVRLEGGVGGASYTNTFGQQVGHNSVRNAFQTLVDRIERGLDPNVTPESVKNLLTGTALAKEYSEEELFDAFTDYAKRVARPDSDSEDPMKAVVKLSTGEWHVPTSVLLDRAAFDKVVGADSPIPSRQKAVLRGTREARLEEESGEILRAFTHHNPKFTAFYDRRLSEGASKVQVMEEWRAMPENHSAWADYTKGVARSFFEGAASIPLMGAAMMWDDGEGVTGSIGNWSKDVLSKWREDDRMKREYASVFGTNLNWKYDAAVLFGPVVADLAVSRGIATAATSAARAAARAAPRTLRATTRSFLEKTISSDSRTLAKRFIESSAARGSQGAKGLTSEGVIQAMGRDMTGAVFKGSGYAAVAATSYNRSAGMTYVSLHNLLSAETNADGTPKYTPEQVREISLTHANVAGMWTVATVWGFMGLGIGGLEKLAISRGMTRRQLAGVHARLRKDMAKADPAVFKGVDMTTPMTMLDTMAKRGVGRLRELAGAAGQEGVQEALDEFGQYFNEAVATGDLINIRDAVRQAGYAGLLGSIMGGSVTLAARATSRLTTPATPDVYEENAVRRNYLLEIARNLENSNAPETAKIVRAMTAENRAAAAGAVRSMAEMGGVFPTTPDNATRTTAQPDPAAAAQPDPAAAAQPDPAAAAQPDPAAAAQPGLPGAQEDVPASDGGTGGVEASGQPDVASPAEVSVTPEQAVQELESSLGDLTPSVAKKARAMILENAEMIAQLRSQGVKIGIFKTKSEFEASVGKTPSGNKTAKGTSYKMPDGTLGIAFYARAFSSKAQFEQTLGHEASHIAQYRFETTSEGQEALAASRGMFDPANTALYDAKLDEFMRKEYPKWDSLGEDSKVREAGRAIMEGQAKGQTSGFKPGIFSYLKRFLDYVNRTMPDGSPLAKYVQGATAELASIQQKPASRNAASPNGVNGAKPSTPPSQLAEAAVEQAAPADDTPEARFQQADSSAAPNPTVEEILEPEPQTDEEKRVYTVNRVRKSDNPELALKDDPVARQAVVDTLVKMGLPAEITNLSNGDLISLLGRGPERANQTAEVTKELGDSVYNTAEFLGNLAKGKGPLAKFAKLLSGFPEFIEETKITLIENPMADWSGVHIPGVGVIINTAVRGPRGAIDTLIHEYTHAATQTAVRLARAGMSTPASRRLLQRIDRHRMAISRRARARDRYTRDMQYALSNIDEFIAHWFTDAGFQAQVEALTPDGERSWAQVFAENIANLLDKSRRGKTQGQLITAELMLDMTAFTRRALEGDDEFGLSRRQQLLGMGEAQFQRASDAEYLSLAQDPEKNREALQRMVDEAARARGYDIGPIYHGSTKARGNFNVFRNGVTKKDAFRLAFDGLGPGWFTSNEEQAGTFSGKQGRVLSAHIKLEKPWTVFADEFAVAEHAERYRELQALKKKDRENSGNDPVKGWFRDGLTFEERARIKELYALGANEEITKGDSWEGLEKLRDEAKLQYPELSDGEAVRKGLSDQGYDGIILEATTADGGFATDTRVGNLWVIPFRGEEQIKSADPVTYDADGNVIPLSQRFDAASPDIRFQKVDDFSTPEFDEEINKYITGNWPADAEGRYKELQSFAEQWAARYGDLADRVEFTDPGGRARARAEIEPSGSVIVRIAPELLESVSRKTDEVLAKRQTAFILTEEFFHAAELRALKDVVGEQTNYLPPMRAGATSDIEGRDSTNEWVSNAMRLVNEAAQRDTARFVELTRDLYADRDSATAQEIEAWKAANPDKWQELSEMRETVLKEAGWDVKAYHGTDKEGISIFKKRGVATNFNNPQRLLGYFFASDPNYAVQYGNNVIPVFLKGVFSEEPSSTIDRIENGSDSNAKQWKKRRSDKGFTGAKFGSGASEEVVVFDPSQIKSADPISPGPMVTPDQWGDAESPDIRFQRAGDSGGRTTAPEGTPSILTTDGRVLTLPALFQIAAWHGTPHRFSRFDMSKIGTGEGAQVYGRGLYFAEAKRVAEDYRRNLSGPPRKSYKGEKSLTVEEIQDRGWHDETDSPLGVEGLSARSIIASAREAGIGIEYSREDIVPDIVTRWAKEQGYLSRQSEEAIRKEATNLDANAFAVEAGNLYRVELDVEPEDLLDWDKPLSEQTEKMQRILKESGLWVENTSAMLGDIEISFAEPTGSTLYEKLAGGKSVDQLQGSAEKATERLLAAGIPGIRYLDGNSRSSGEGSYNYVIFDDALIKITEENGNPVTVEAAFQFAGERARLPQFMADSLETAKAMAAAGKPSKEIRAVTGWFPGPYDGKMRWEIPDNGAEFIPYEQYSKKAKAVYGGEVFNSLSMSHALDRINRGEVLRLSEVFTHPAVFEAYPAAADIPFFPIGGNIVNASFRTLDGKPMITATVTLSGGRISSESSSAILHEVQHFIQSVEGFARGGSADSLITKSDIVDAGRFRESQKALKKYQNELDHFTQEIAKEQSKKGFLGMGGPNAKQLAFLNESAQSVQNSINRVWEALKKDISVDKDSVRRALLQGVNRVEDLLGVAWAINPSTRNKGLDMLYRSLAGEIEARDVQARANLTPEQLKAIEPYSSENIAPEDAIVMFQRAGDDAKPSLFQIAFDQFPGDRAAVDAALRDLEADDFDDAAPDIAADVVRSAVARELAHAAGAEAAKGVDPEQLRRTLDHVGSHPTVSAVPSADDMRYYGDQEALDGLVTYLDAARGKLETILSERFDSRTAILADRLGRHAARARRGFRVENTTLPFDPENPAETENLLRFQKVDDSSTPEFDEEINKYITGNWPADAVSRAQELSSFSQQWAARYGDLADRVEFPATNGDAGFRASVEKDGAVVVRIPRDLLGQIAGQPGEFAAKREVAAILTEEFFHAATFKALQDITGKENPSAPFELMGRVYENVFDSMRKDREAASAISASMAVYRERYGPTSFFEEAKPDDALLFMEGRKDLLVGELSRQIFQLTRMGTTSEIVRSKEQKALVEKLMERLNTFVSGRRSFGDEMAELVDASTKQLDQRGIRFQKVDDSSSAPVQFTHYTSLHHGDPEAQAGADSKAGWFTRMFARTDDMRTPWSKVRRNRKGESQAIEAQHARLNNRFKAVIAKSNAGVELLDAALGSTAPLLTPKAETEINEMLDSAKKLATDTRERLTKEARVQMTEDLKVENERHAAEVTALTDQKDVKRAEREHKAEVREIRDRYDESLADAETEYDRILYGASELAARQRIEAEVEEANRLRQERDNALAELERVNPDLHDWAVRMRTTINELQRKVRDLYGDRPYLSAKIDRSLGVYLVRSYRIHQDPSLARKILKSPEYAELRERATAFFAEKLQAQEEENIRRQFPEMDPAAVTQQARATADELAVGAFEDFILGHEAMTSSLGTSAASNDIRTEVVRFMRKQNIPPILREALQENTDPVFNAERTAASLANILSVQQSVRTIQEEGVKAGWLVSKSEFLNGIPKYRGLGDAESAKRLLEDPAFAEAREIILKEARDALETPIREDLYRTLGDDRGGLSQAEFDKKAGQITEARAQEYLEGLASGRYRPVQEIPGSGVTPERLVQALQNHENPAIRSMFAIERDRATARKWVPLISTKGASSPYAPLAEWYASPEDAEAFSAAFFPNKGVPQSSAGKMFAYTNRLALSAAGLSLGIVTLGNPAYYFRNVVGNTTIMLAQGVNPFSAESWRAYTNTIRGAFDMDGDFNADIDELIALRILKDGAKIEYLRDLLSRWAENPLGLMDSVNDALSEANQRAGDIMAKGRKMSKQGLAALGKLAEVTETYPSVAIYYHMKSLLQEANFGTPQEIRQEAARRTKMVTPSKSEASQAVDAFTKSGWGALLAPFIRFKADMWRTTINTYILALADTRSENPVLRASGKRRMASAATVHILVTAALGEIFKMIMGIGDDEDRAIRSGLPVYNKDASLVYVPDKENGTVTISNLTFLNPFSFVFNPFVASIRNIRTGDYEESVAVWARYVGEEFFGENIAVGRALDVKRNLDDSTGRAVYQPTDSLFEKSRKSLAHIFDGAYNPALFKQIDRFADAVGSDAPKDSFWFTPMGILVGTVAPFKPRAYTVADLEYRSFSNLRRTNGDLWMHTAPLLARSPVSDRKVASLYESRVEAQRKVWDDVRRNMAGFEALGRSRREVASQAVEAGLSRKRVNLALRGLTERPVFSPESLLKVRKLDAQRYNAYMDSVRKYPGLITLD